MPRNCIFALSWFAGQVRRYEIVFFRAAAGRNYVMTRNCLFSWLCRARVIARISFLGAWNSSWYRLRESSSVTV